MHSQKIIGEDLMSWLRVNLKNKCPICNHADWCCIGDKYINCMRAVSDFQCKNGGWLHKKDDKHTVQAIYGSQNFSKEKPLNVNCSLIWNKWFQTTHPNQLKIFANKLGIEAMALHFLGCAWSDANSAYAFPMKDENHQVIGIRLRNLNGDKWSIKGSRAGLFIPEIDFKVCDQLFINEGPTDCAAALSLECFTIGRPSCLGSEQQINAFVKKYRIKKVIIISDNDSPGFKGAVKLQSSLNVPSLIWKTPVKDLRQFVKQGGNLELVASMTKNLVWTLPKEFL